MTKIASADELETELRKLLAYAEMPNPSRLVLASGLSTLSLRVSWKVALQKMDNEALIQAFDSLRTRQKVRVTLRAVMGHGPSENGTPTEYIVGRRTKSRGGVERGGVESVHLLPADGSNAHPMSKVTLFKRKDYQDETYVSVALGDMGATLMAIEPV